MHSLHEAERETHDTFGEQGTKCLANGAFIVIDGRQIKEPVACLHRCTDGSVDVLRREAPRAKADLGHLARGRQ